MLEYDPSAATPSEQLNAAIPIVATWLLLVGIRNVPAGSDGSSGETTLENLLIGLAHLLSGPLQGIAALAAVAAMLSYVMPLRTECIGRFALAITVVACSVATAPILAAPAASVLVRLMVLVVTMIGIPVAVCNFFVARWGTWGK